MLCKTEVRAIIPEVAKDALSAFLLCPNQSDRVPQMGLMKIMTKPFILAATPAHRAASRRSKPPSSWVKRGRKGPANWKPTDVKSWAAIMNFRYLRQGACFSAVTWGRNLMGVFFCKVRSVVPPCVLRSSQAQDKIIAFQSSLGLLDYVIGRGSQ